MYKLAPEVEFEPTTKRSQAQGVPVAELAGKFRRSRQCIWQILGPREGRPPRHKRMLVRIS
jgi:hypothetical protein